LTSRSWTVWQPSHFHDRSFSVNPSYFLPQQWQSLLLANHWSCAAETDRKEMERETMS
jgi:hypothetical protein